MHFFPLRTTAILLVMIAVSVAGCSDSVPPVSSEPAPQTTATMIKTKGITISQPATSFTTIITESPVKVFNGEYHWVEYRKNITQTLPPNPRYQWEYPVKTERSPEIYQGVPSIHEKITSRLDYPEWVGGTLINTERGWIVVTDLYFEVSTNRFLGGTSTETIKGISKPPANLPADVQFSRENKPSRELGITPFGEMNISLTEEGTESVTVPAGTYPDARKYAGNFRDGTPITFWVAPGVPVPVQYRFPNKYLDGDDPFQSYELKAWG
jgi:hypothetical protein